MASFRSILGWLLAALAASRAGAQLPAGTWQYQWGDEFTLGSLDDKKWIDAYPWGRTHNHDAYMAPENVILGDGTLTLRAQRLAQGGKAFTSGVISTGYSKFRVNGGYIEARILLPDTPGSWPAFWGLDNGWPPEADIMEYPIDTAAGSGYTQEEYHTAFHYRNTSGGNSAGAGKVNPSSLGDLGGAYHNFGMEWRQDDWVGFYVDGQLVSQFGDDAAITQMTSMYLIFNYAVGGWPGTPSLSEWSSTHVDETKIDWVRVWQQAASRSTNWAYSGASELAQWDTAANWSNGSPNLGGVTAGFSTVTGIAEQRIDWTGIRTLSAINLDGATRFRLGWPDDRLILAGADNATGSAAINVAATSSIDHEIRAELELFSTLAVNNASSQPLTLGGKVFGIGGLTINGAGTVVLSSGANTYLGDTIIDSGTQGPAVVRVAASNPFGSGDVVIGQNGNTTTARLELTDNSTVANSIGFNGRNNASIGIQNLSGNNILSGAVNLGAGGSTYLIQCDAGLLTLSGSASGGIALQSQASGARTITLAGSGSGQVTGRIQNGSASALNVIKAGSGTWTFTGSHGYTGTTAVNAGTLRVDGSIAASSGVTVAGGAVFTAGVTQVVKTLDLSAASSSATILAGAIRVLSVGDNTAAAPLTLTGGKLDLNSGALVVDFSAGNESANLAALRSAVLAGRNGGNWNGATGITSSAAAAGSALYAVGYAPSSILSAPIDGVTADSSSVVARFTRLGDANLDGAVNFFDLTALAANYGVGGEWHNGDFDYNGTVNFFDLTAMASNYAGALPGEPIPAATAQFNDDLARAFATVPEPGTLLALSAWVLIVFARRGHGLIIHSRMTQKGRQECLPHH